MLLPPPNPGDDSHRQSDRPLLPYPLRTPHTDASGQFIAAGSLVAVVTAIAALLLPPFLMLTFVFACLVWVSMHAHLTANYWRPPRLILWLPWVLTTWISVVLISACMTILGWMASLPHGAIFVFFLCPILILGCAASLRRSRSDHILLVSLVTPAALFLTGAVLLAWASLRPPPKDYFGLAILFAILVMITAFLMALGPAIGLAHLKHTRRYGTTPVQLTPSCTACQYDLTGSALAGQTTCPECGISIPTSQIQCILQTQTDSHNPPTP